MFKRLLLLLALGITLYTVSKPTTKKEIVQDNDDYDFSELYLDCIN
jgi:hypothetical protein